MGLADTYWPEERSAIVRGFLDVDGPIAAAIARHINEARPTPPVPTFSIPQFSATANVRCAHQWETYGLGHGGESTYCRRCHLVVHR